MKDFRLKIPDFRWIAAVAVLLLCVAAAASAQTQPPPAPPAATDGFVPMSAAAPREVLPATPLVFYAYAFVWLALIVYVFTIWRRMARVEQDLADVQRRLKEGQDRH
jgi:hypothetical protein